MTLTDAQVEALLTERRIARKRRDFKQAVAITNQLFRAGIYVEATPVGIKWRRIEPPEDRDTSTTSAADRRD